MPNLIQLKRTVAQSQIDFNPSNITFDREEITYNDTTGSLNYTNSQYIETIRITKTNNMKPQLTQALGLDFKKEGYVLLGNYQSNMKATKNIKDYFTLDAQRYKITSVMINKEKDEITSIQAIAEVVENWVQT